MRSRHLIILLIAILCSVQKIIAQQDAQFSQYMYNTLYYNPAFAGVEGVTKFTLVHRTQWAGFKTSFDGSGGNPTTQVLSATTPIFKIKGGVGLHIVNDNLGPQNNIEVQLSYAYHREIKDAKISAGLRIGIFSQTLDFSKYRPVDINDPLLLLKGRESQIRPDMALGFYYRARKYYGGISLNHVLKSEFDFGNSNQRSALESNFTITGGFDYQLNFNITISPVVLVKTDFNQYSFDVGAIATYNNKMWGGISFRQSEAAIIILGYSLLKDNSLRLGYSFDYIIEEQGAKQPTSHEILLTYALPVTKEPRKIIRTPRFNF